MHPNFFKTLKFGVVLILVIVLYSFASRLRTKQETLLSPLPLTIANHSVSKDSFYWYPKIDKVYDKGIKKPKITSDSALSYDLTREKLLYAQNIKKRLPIASLTKIMTAIVAIENENLNHEVKIDKNAASTGENSMGLSEGEVLSLEELLYGLALPSGNDAAEAIAQGSRSGRANFVYTMNKRAEDLGLTDTHFTNPTGLEGDGEQFSSSVDLLVMTQYALKNPAFRKIVSTVEYRIPKNDKHKEFYLFNETNLLTSYPGVKGVKVGFTNEAGYCLVTYLEYQGHKIITVLLNSQNRRQEMKDLLDYSLKTLGVVPPSHL